MAPDVAGAPWIGSGTGYKLPGRSLIRTAWLDELGEILAREAEPKRFSYLERAAHAPSELSLLSLPRSRIYGMSHGSAVRCNTARLDCFEFIFLIDGVLLSGFPGSQQRIAPGEAVLHLPGWRHCASWDAGSRAVILRVEPAVLAPYGYDHRRFEGLGRDSPIRVLALGSGLGRTLAGLCGQICEEAERVTTADEDRRQEDLLLYAVELVIERLTGLHPAGTGGGALPPYLKKTIEFIQANLERKLDTATLAAVSGMSGRTLQQAFADHLGTSPLAFVKSARLQRIHDELLRANAWETTVTDVAVRWGFTHLSNFSCNYKKAFGESPSRTLKKEGFGTTVGPADQFV